MIDQPYRSHSWLPTFIRVRDTRDMEDIFKLGIERRLRLSFDDIPQPKRQKQPTRNVPEKDADGRVPLSYAKERAEKIKEHLAPACQRIEIAGSIRRGKSTIKDIEIVAISNGDDLWRLLDEKLTDGKIFKAVYGYKKDAPQYRWGKKYRGFMWGEMRIEVFAATPDNWGYQLWLRTGPGDANTALKHNEAPFAFKDGYAVMGILEERIPLREEIDLFNLCGLPYIEPRDRTAQRYWREFNQPNHRWFKESLREPA